MAVDFTFADRDDARRYLGEVGALWVIWIVSLFVITFSSGGLRLLTGIVGLVVTVWRTYPLQRRAAILVPDEEAQVNVGLRGGLRERTFRKLAYGAEPLRVAVPAAGATSIWYVFRIGMLAMTVLGFVAVLLDYTT
jgi:hypothetical protein